MLPYLTLFLQVQLSGHAQRKQQFLRVQAWGHYKAEAVSGNRGKQGGNQEAHANCCPAEHPARRMTGSGVCRGKGASWLPPCFLHPCTSILRNGIPTSDSVCRHARYQRPLRRSFGRDLYHLNRCRAGGRCTRPGCRWCPLRLLTCLAGTLRSSACLS